MTKVLAYIRYSSHNQDEGNSVAAQTTTIQNYADTHNMEIEEYYIDMAKTGRNTNRPKYQQMKEDIQNNAVEAKCIIIRAMDRLHRNAKNQLQDMEWFDSHGIRLISVTDGIDTAADTSKLVTTIKAAVAEDFSETLSKNTRAALLECAKQCRHLGGTAPIGYRVTAEGMYEIDELKAPIVRDIFRLYLQDMGYEYIIKHLKDKGYTTNEGKDFTKSSLYTILKNPKYTGTYVYDRSTPKNSEGKRNSHKYKSEYVSIKEGMPQIVSQRDFEKVQRKMADNRTKYNKRASKHYYPLNGKLHCANCGKPFSGNVSHSKNKKYYSYRKTCQCEVKNVNMEKLNDFTFYALQQCIFCNENKDKLIKKINARLTKDKALKASNENALENKIHGLENAQRNLTGYLESGRATKTIMEKMDINEKEIASLKNQLEALSSTTNTIDEKEYDRLVRHFLSYMGTVRSPEGAALIDAAIEDIDIGGNIDVTFKSGVTADEETINYLNEGKEQ